MNKFIIIMQGGKFMKFKSFLSKKFLLILLTVFLLLIFLIITIANLNNVFLTNLTINILSIIFTIFLFLLLFKTLLYSHINSKKFIVKSFAVLYILIGMFFYFNENPQYILNKNTKKMFAVVNDGPFQVWVEYYDYTNPFFVHKENLRFIEFYGGGSYDPIKNPNSEPKGINYIN